MKKTTNGILIGLACTSILSLSTGVQSVKANSQESVKQTQELKQNGLQDVTDLKVLTPQYFISFRANNLLNGKVTDKTNQIAINQNNVPIAPFCIIDSTGSVVYTFSTHLTGQTIDIDPPFKAGETYTLKVLGYDNTSFFQFTVASSEVIGTPTINKVTSQDTTITGTGIPGAKVNLTIAGDHYTGNVDSSGNYSIPLNKTYAVDSEIIVYQEKDSIKSDSVTAKVVAADKLEIPKINTVTDKDTIVTGTAAPGATVYLTVDGQNFRTVALDNGQFSINIEKTYPAKTPIQVHQELNGIRSETTEVFVQLTTHFIIDEIKSNATSITGSGHPNAQLTVQIDDEYFSGTVDGYGNFIIDLHGAKFKVGTNVTITSESSEGTETKTVQIYPQDPVIGIVYQGDADIRGTADPGATVIITIGAEKYQTTADSNGNFRQSVNPNLVISGTLVTVYSNIEGYKSDKVTQTVI